MITMIYCLHNLKIVASKVGKQVFWCLCFIFPVFKGKCESCAAKPVPKGIYFMACVI